MTAATTNTATAADTITEDLHDLCAELRARAGDECGTVYEDDIKIDANGIVTQLYMSWAVRSQVLWAQSHGSSCSVQSADQTYHVDAGGFALGRLQ